MEDNSTKELITQAALAMFAKRGYQAVSIRDIAKVVGIKESSIYYHFKNKQAIMDELLNKIDSLIRKMKENFADAFATATEVSEEAMCSVAVGILENYLMHPFVYPVIQMLSIERLADKRADEIYQRIVFYLPLAQHQEVFRQMIERGYIIENSACVLAQEYYAVIYLAFQKNCMGCNVTEAAKEEACNEIRENILDLYHKMKGGKR
jgi:TetR/AcrR family transcriptional regulator, biofilm operon repressor